jgi:hypothetical protein
MMRGLGSAAGEDSDVADLELDMVGDRIWTIIYAEPQICAKYAR